MAFSDELIRASQAFKTNMQDLAQTRAVKEATKQVNQIKQQEQNELAQRQQIEQIGQQLSQQLMGTGASATEAAGALQIFQPQAPKTPQSDILTGAEALTTAETPEARTQATQRVQRGLTKQRLLSQVEAEREAAKLEAELMRDLQKQKGKLSKEARTATKKLMGDFRKDNKGAFEAAKQIAPAIKLLRTNERVGRIPVKNAARAILKTAGEQRLSDFDLQTATPGGESTAFQFLSRVRAEGLDPQSLEAEKEILENVLTELSGGLRDALREDAQNKAKAFAKEIPGRDTQALQQRLETLVPSNESFGLISKSTVLDQVKNTVQSKPMRDAIEASLNSPGDPEAEQFLRETAAPMLGIDPDKLVNLQEAQ